jgi:hypothetical protein
MKTATKPNRKTTNTIDPVLPAPPLAQQHALALLQFAHHLHRHWESFAALFSEPSACAVNEKRIDDAFNTLLDQLEEWARSCAFSLSDSEYREGLAEIKQCIEYEPIEQLQVIMELVRQSDERARNIASTDGQKGE